MAGRTKESLPGGSLKYLFVYFKSVYLNVVTVYIYIYDYIPLIYIYMYIHYTYIDESQLPHCDVTMAGFWGIMARFSKCFCGTQSAGDRLGGRNHNINIWFRMFGVLKCGYPPKKMVGLSKEV